MITALKIDAQRLERTVEPPALGTESRCDDRWRSVMPARTDREQRESIGHDRSCRCSGSTEEKYSIFLALYRRE
jgi:hypothetical protein